MQKTKKLTVGVLFGGKSAEHEVSCVSAYSVLSNIDRDRYEVKMVGITKDGDFLPFEALLKTLASLDGTVQIQSTELQKALKFLKAATSFSLFCMVQMVKTEQCRVF